MILKSKYQTGRGVTLAAVFSLAAGSLLLLCGAGSAPIENLLPQGAMQGDLNAGGHAITNAASVCATNVISTTLNLKSGGLNARLQSSQSQYASSADEMQFSLSGADNVLELYNGNSSGYSGITEWANPSGTPLEVMAMGVRSDMTGFFGNPFIEVSSKTGIPASFDIDMDGVYTGEAMSYNHIFHIDGPTGDTTLHALSATSGFALSVITPRDRGNAMQVEDTDSVGFSAIAFNDYNGNEEVVQGYANPGVDGGAAPLAASAYTLYHTANYIFESFDGVSTFRQALTLDQVGDGIFLGNLSSGGTFSGFGLQIKEGANCRQGSASLSGGTVTVSDTAVTANSRFFLTPHGATVSAVGISAVVPGTSFTIKSASGSDTNTVDYEIFEPAP